MQNKKTGMKGELLARQFLQAKGLELQSCNWRAGRCEIDLIFREREALIFVEVKTRSSEHFGSPGSFLSPTQEQRIAQAAYRYCELQDHQWEIRFDLVEVVLFPGRAPIIRHYEDAFFPGDDGW
jgi:putative endonuclease